MKHLLLTTIAAVLLVCAGACTAFAPVQFLNEKIDLCSKTSVELKKLKNKENIEAKTRIRFAAYNVLFGLWAKPKSIGEMFKQYDLDVICFNEVPNGDWTARVGRVLGMDHVHVGKVSSANHRNKYKSILCRFPLFDKREVSATIVATDPLSDIAVIQIDSDNLQEANPGNSTNLQIGEWVIAIGSPFG